MRGYHFIHLLINVLPSNHCESALALNPRTHSATFYKTGEKVIYLKNQCCSFPRCVTGHWPPQEESLQSHSSPFIMTSGGIIRLQLVSFQPDVPVLQFTFLCCVVILATLISVLHFIFTSKENMLVNFHWISGPLSGPPCLVCAFWQLPFTLASAAIQGRTVTFKYSTTTSPYKLCLEMYLI